MKRYAIIVAAGILAAACGSSSPSGPSSQPNTIVFTAALSSQNEVPPITNADVNARGIGTFTLNLTRDSSGTITDATGTFVYNLTGFPPGTQIRLTHIHDAGPGVNGGVVVDTGLTAANPITLADGTLTGQTFSNRPVGAALAQRIIDNPNGFYFNVHSVLNPGGAVRAQLVKQ
jgi:CHRD domain-containing protein